jgi:hypothetical protein
VEAAVSQQYDRAKADKIMADALGHCGNIVSGLNLDAIGEDGHEVASLLWKISGYLKKRNQSREDFGDEEDDTPEQEV